MFLLSGVYPLCLFEWMGLVSPHRGVLSGIASKSLVTYTRRSGNRTFLTYRRVRRGLVGSNGDMGCYSVGRGTMLVSGAGVYSRQIWDRSVFMAQIRNLRGRTRREYCRFCFRVSRSTFLQSRVGLRVVEFKQNPRGRAGGYSVRIFCFGEVESCFYSRK